MLFRPDTDIDSLDILLVMLLIEICIHWKRMKREQTQNTIPSLAKKFVAIHPASRGVAAHTAGLIRSVRGAKGGFPPWGLFKLRSFNKKSFQNIVFDSVFPMFPVKQTVIYTFFAIKAVNPSKTLLLTVFL